MNNVIVYGDCCTGKTTHSEALRAFYGKERVIDDFSHKRNPSQFRNCLLIAESPSVQGLDSTDRVVYIKTALMEAGL